MPDSKLAAILRRLRGSLIAYLRYYRGCTSLSEGIELHEPPPAGLEIHQVTYDNVELIREWKGPLYVRRFRSLLNRGYLGLYGIMDGEVVSYIWAVAKLDTRSPGCSQDLMEVGDAMQGRLETRPEYRRRGIGSHSRARMLELLRQHCGGRVKRVWGAGLVHNEPMHRLVAKSRGGRRMHYQGMHLVVLLGHVYVYRMWDLEPDTGRRAGRGRLFVRIKAPDFLFSPAFKWLGLGPQPVPLLTAKQAHTAEPV